jgi:hypothetical protein
MHYRGQITIPMLLSVLIPKPRAAWPHHRRQVAVPVPLSVLPPLLSSVRAHYRGQIAIPMQLSVGVKPSLSPISIRCEAHWSKRV